MRLGSAFAVLYCVGASVLLFGGLADALPYVIDGHDVTREQWLQGAAPLFAVTIILMVVIAYGLLGRRVWSRHVVMIHWAAILAYGGFLYLRESIAPALALRVMAQAAALGLFAAWYFYRKPNVVAYFRSLGAADSAAGSTDSAP
jgi:hypothetical protein